MKPPVSVAVVSICGATHLRRCLAALLRQEGAESFEIVVAYDPDLFGIDQLATEYPAIRFFSNVGQRTPLELASRAIQASAGEVVLLTEDHCVPDPDWVRSMMPELREGRAGVGGVVDIAADATATDWAFYFVDFFRYADPVAEGPSPTLTVCNVAYRRADLEGLDDSSWKALFHETAVNDALYRRFGVLYLTGRGRVTMRRHVALREAIRERYAFGRLFGCTRLRHLPGMAARLAHRAGAPLLPVLLMLRMAGKASKSSTLRRRFTLSFFPLLLMVLAWSWGEWLGYLTGRYPARLTVAPEVD